MVFPIPALQRPHVSVLLLPLTKKAGLTRTSQAFLTFIQDYGFLGGVMALAEPSGLMHPYWTLTLHGLLWHLLLLFMGFFCAQSGLGGRSRRVFSMPCLCSFSAVPPPPPSIFSRTPTGMPICSTSAPIIPTGRPYFIRSPWPSARCPESALSFIHHPGSRHHPSAAWPRKQPRIPSLLQAPAARPAGKPSVIPLP